MEGNILNSDDVCRLCVESLNNQVVSKLFMADAQNELTSLPQKIYICSSIQVFEEDGLPQYICGVCLEKLNHSFCFRNQCIAADITLRGMPTSQVKLERSSDNSTPIPSPINIDLPCVEESCIVKTETKTNYEKTNSQKMKQERPYQLITEKNSKKQVVKSKKNAHRKASVVLQRTNMTKVRLGLRQRQLMEKENEVKSSICNKGEMYQPSEITVGKSNGENRKRRKKELGKKGKQFSPITVKPICYVCQFCQKMYPSEGGWRYHIHTVHNESYQPFICDLCGKSFKVKKNLDAHKNSIHYHLKQHLCDVCGRGFATKYALKVHKIWHNDERDFICEICNSKFRTRGKLNTHRAIHGGPKKFMCDVCSREFRWKKDFEIHMRTHTGEKPYSCSHCTKSFSSLTNMKKHERNHVGSSRSSQDKDQISTQQRTNKTVLPDFSFEVDFAVIEMEEHGSISESTACR